MRKAISVFIIFVVFATTSASYAATYYVRTDGHDTASGANDTNNATTGAWLTIQKGATAGTCGDTVIVGDGTYNQPSDQPGGHLISATLNCTAGAPLTIRAANKWGAILNGYPLRSRELILITGSYYIVDGFKYQGWIYGVASSALSVAGSYNIVTNVYGNANQMHNVEINGDHNTLSNSYMFNSQFGIIVGGSNNLIVNNEVNQLNNWWVGMDTDYLRYGGTGNTMRGNYFHGADVPRLTAAGSHIDCFQAFYEAGGGGPTSNTVIENNYCSETHQGVNQSCTLKGCDGTIARNNVFTGSTGICAISSDVTNFKVYNNTCDVTASGCVSSPGGCFGIICGGGSTCDFKNNIIVGVAAGQIPVGLSGGAWISDSERNNLIYSVYQSYNQARYPNDIVNQDPLLTGTYKLQFGSPAINVGADLSATGFKKDKNGIARPQGEAWNIGAYEYNKIEPPRNLRIK